MSINNLLSSKDGRRRKALEKEVAIKNKITKDMKKIVIWVVVIVIILLLLPIAGRLLSSLIGIALLGGVVYLVYKNREKIKKLL